ncbi:MAG: tyrosine-type recombinase/integrase [Chloroflexi bacterium]|nr:tyrosine-type recombinase/integrase [Chloroflexota bacterium]MDA8237985.1 tyrosine-type recombinase/integrase [Chloroflexota bacterium]
MRAVAVASAVPRLDEFALADVISEYLSALKVAGRSPKTISWYADMLWEFVRFIEREGVRATVADVAPVEVRRWLLAIQSRRTRSLAPSSMAARVRTVKAFGTWIANELDLPANPVRGVPVPRVPELLVPSLREPDILALLRTLDAGSQQPERDRAIVLLLLDTGLRLSEAANLRIRDVDLIEGRCRVMGKGGRERVVPVGRKTRRALRHCLARRGRLLPDEALFIGRGGRALAPRGIQQLVRRLSRRTTLASRCSPHVLRHTFARSFLANGGDVFSLQRILGHSPSSLQVTRRYVDLLDDDLRAVHREASPVDRLG